MKQIPQRSSLTQVSPPMNLSCKQINCSKHCFGHATDLIPTFWIKWKHLRSDSNILDQMKASQPGSKSHRVYPWCIFLDSSNYSSLALLTKTDSLEHWLASVYVWIIWISESSHVLTFSQLIWCFLKFQNQVQILTPVYGLSWFRPTHDDLLNSIYSTNIQSIIHIKLCNIFYFDMYIVYPQLHFIYLVQRTCLVFLRQSFTVSSY